LKALIICGGKATRMRPISNYLPKDLIPLFDEPVIAHIIDDALNAGLEKVIVSTTPKKAELFKKYLKYKKYDERVKIIDEPDAGVAYRTFSMRPFLEHDKFFIVNYGDNLGETNLFKRTLNEFEKLEEKSTFVLLKEVDNIERCAAVRFGENKQIVEIIEKPKKEEAPSNVSAMANFILDSEKFFSYGKENVRLVHKYPPQFVLENRGLVKGYFYNKGYVDVGKPSDILKACKILIRRKFGKGQVILSKVKNPVIVKNRVYIGKNCGISDSISLEDSFVNSNTIIGKNVKLENTYLMGNNKIGEKSEVKNSIIFRNAVIPKNRAIKNKIIIGNRNYTLE